jgi:hypothetical protein
MNAAQSTCVKVYVSSVNGYYALIDFDRYPIPENCHEPANGIMIMHYRDHRWRFVFAGSSYRCPIRGVPKRVGRDLKACPY